MVSLYTVWSRDKRPAILAFQTRQVSDGKQYRMYKYAFVPSLYTHTGSLYIECHGEEEVCVVCQVNIDPDTKQLYIGHVDAAIYSADEQHQYGGKKMLKRMLKQSEIKQWVSKLFDSSWHLHLQFNYAKVYAKAKKRVMKKLQHLPPKDADRIATFYVNWDKPIDLVNLELEELVKRHSASIQPERARIVAI